MNHPAGPASFMRAALLSLLYILVLALSSCSHSPDPANTASPTAPEKATVASKSGEATSNTWTLMMYSAADAPSTFSPLQSLQSSFPSSDVVNVLCFDDRWGQTAKLWYIDENGGAVLLEDAGEVNTGDLSTLSYFLEYTKAHYPADRYIMCFYGHGGAWGGACTDLAPEVGVLRMWEMQEALEAFGGVDLVCFTAPCLMGALESAYELRNCTDAYVASEGLSFYDFWNVAMRQLAAELNANPDIESEELGGLIIEWIKGNRKFWASYGSVHYLTMSAIRTSGLDALKGAIDDLALSYMADPAGLRALLDEARKKILYFDNVSICDLRSVMLRLYNEESDPARRELIEKVNERLAEAVISEIHNQKFGDAGGLTIFLPDAATASIIPKYVDAEWSLDFATDTHWDELLFAAFPEAQAGAPATALPRELVERFLLQSERGSK